MRRQQKNYWKELYNRLKKAVQKTARPVGMKQEPQWALQPVRRRQPIEGS